jgi:hypothetical protein
MRRIRNQAVYEPTVRSHEGDRESHAVAPVERGDGNVAGGRAHHDALHVAVAAREVDLSQSSFACEAILDDKVSVNNRYIDAIAFDYHDFIITDLGVPGSFCLEHRYSPFGERPRFVAEAKMENYDADIFGSRFARNAETT